MVWEEASELDAQMSTANICFLFTLLAVRIVFGKEERKKQNALSDRVEVS